MGGRGSGRKPAPKQGDGESIKARLRRRELLFSAELTRMMAEVDPEDVKGRRRLRVVADNLYDMAKGKGPGCPPSLKAIKEIADRVEGTPVQNITMDVSTTPEEEILEIQRLLKELSDEDKPDAEIGPKTTIN